MSRLLCCLDMGAALSHQEGEACDGAGLPASPPTMADVIRERKKKAGGAGLGTLRRRLAAAARRPRDARPDRGCEHARFIRSVVSSWRLAEVFLLCEELEAGAALRDLATQAELARQPAPALHAALAPAYRDRWWCDVELAGAGWSICAHRAILSARCTYFRDLLHRHPPSVCLIRLDGVCASLSRAELDACIYAMYAGATACTKWEHDGSSDGDLDIIPDGANSRRSSCRCGVSDAATVSRLAAVLGFTPGALQRDMRYLLDSGEMSDCRLSWGSFELPAHRLVLAARSRYFRSVMSRRGGGGGGAGAVRVDEQVLPRRFAAPLLHAAYTDQVDLSLIGRNANSPTSAGAGGNNNSAWVSRGRTTPTQALDDAFQLYEIARFLEMWIVVQGCEDAIVAALNADTLPHVLRWASAPHASSWVHRQAMRYFRDEFPSIMASSASSRLPRAALSDALNSAFLQASEAQALRALLRWAERAASAEEHAEPNVVWHTAHSVSRRGGRRREVSDAALRETLAALLPHVRLEHLPPDYELMHQLIRRGIITQPPPPLGEDGSTADAWLGRGSYRPARCFLPYLDEIKALLEEQAPPEAELCRLRRARYMHRIPDTLYMVAAARAGSSPTSVRAAACSSACVSGRVLAALHARARELCRAPPAARARRLAAHRPPAARLLLHQIALRAVREMSLPDSCAELVLNDMEAINDSVREREWESPGSRRRWEPTPPDCCRLGAGSARCSSAGSLRSLTLEQDNSRASTCRREIPSRSMESAQHRQSSSLCAPSAPRAAAGPPSGSLGAGALDGRLSAAVPDVAMAPNANTHLLTAPPYYTHQGHQHTALANEYSSGGVLQLDLGDGATHTPRPGSRAWRAMAASREASRRHEDERVDLALIRAYSSLVPRGESPSLQPPVHGAGRSRGGGGGAVGAGAASTLPHHYREHGTRERQHGMSVQSRHNELPHQHIPRGRGVPGAGAGAGAGAVAGAGAGAVAGAGCGAPRSSPAHSPAPRRHLLPPPRDYRLEPTYGSSGSGSRGPSPNNYA